VLLIRWGVDAALREPLHSVWLHVPTVALCDAGCNGVLALTGGSGVAISSQQRCSAEEEQRLGRSALPANTAPPRGAAPLTCCFCSQRPRAGYRQSHPIVLRCGMCTLCACAPCVGMEKATLQNLNPGLSWLCTVCAATTASCAHALPAHPPLRCCPSSLQAAPSSKELLSGSGRLLL